MDNGTLFVMMLIGGAFSAAIAAGKGRNAVGWMFAGAMFPVISVIAILCLPAVAPAVEVPTQ
jgi:hypothetical protein